MASRRGKTREKSTSKAKQPTRKSGRKKSFAPQKRNVDPEPVELDFSFYEAQPLQTPDREKKRKREEAGKGADKDSRQKLDDGEKSLGWQFEDSRAESRDNSREARARPDKKTAARRAKEEQESAGRLELSNSTKERVKQIAESLSVDTDDTSGKTVEKIRQNFVADMPSLEVPLVTAGVLERRGHHRRLKLQRRIRYLRAEIAALQKEKQHWERVEQDYSSPASHKSKRPDPQPQDSTDPAASYPSFLSDADKQFLGIASTKQEDPIPSLLNTTQLMMLQVDQIQATLKDVQSFDTMSDRLVESIVAQHHSYFQNLYPNIKNPQTLIKSILHGTTSKMTPDEVGTDE